MKKIFSFLLIFLFTLSLIPVNNVEAYFQDVKLDNPYKKAVDYLGITCYKKIDNLAFKPDEEVTRSTFLFLLFCDEELKDDSTSKTTLPFTDLKGDESFLNEVNFVYEIGAMKGFEDKTFRPNAKINKIEAVKTILEIVSNTEKHFFGDQSINQAVTSDWVENYLQQAIEMNILDSLNKESIFKPITKKEIAEILYRIQVIKISSVKSYNKSLDDTVDLVTTLATNKQKSYIRDLNDIGEILNSYYLYPEEMNSGIPYKSAIKGLLDGLEDPYSSAYEPTEFFQNQVLFDQIDLGFTLDTRTSNSQEYYYVDYIDRNSEAYKSGLRQNYVIINLLTYEEGETFLPKLLIEYQTSIYDGAVKKMKIPIEILDNEAIYATYINNDVLYLRIREFSENIVNTLEKLSADLSNKNIKVSQYILDLRGDRGGELKSLIGVAEFLFEKNKTVFNTVDKFKTNKPVRTTKDPLNNQIWRENKPWKIIVNQNTASASEMLANAIIDYKTPTTILGDYSYGKGKMQAIFSLSDENLVLALTTAEITSPKGRIINENSLNPDIKLTFGELFPVRDLTKDKAVQKAIVAK